MKMESQLQLPICLMFINKKYCFMVINEKQQHSHGYYSLLFVVHAAVFVVKQQMSSATRSLSIKHTVGMW